MEELKIPREATFYGPSDTTPVMAITEALDPELIKIGHLRFNLL